MKLHSDFSGEITFTGTKLTFSSNLSPLRVTGGHLPIVQLVARNTFLEARTISPILREEGVRRVHVKLNSTEVKS